MALAPIVAFFLLIVLLLLYRFRAEPAGRALFRYASFCLWLLATNSAEQWAPTPGATLLFAQLSYISILMLPLSFSDFSLRYTGHDKYVPASMRLMILGIGIALYGVVLTNKHHGLFWRDIQYNQVEGLLVMQPHYGPVFWFTVFYCWVIIVMSMVFVLRAYSLRLGRHRARSLSILIGVLLPGLFNLVYVLKLVPFFRKDYTPIGFGLSAIAFFIGGFMIRAVQLVPMARGVVLEELSEGYLVLDSYGRLSDFNIYTGNIFRLKNSSIGHFFKDLPMLQPLAECYEACSQLIEKRTSHQPIAVNCDLRLNDRYMLVKVRAIYGSAGLRGVAFTLSDISQQIQMQQQLETVRSDLLKRERFAVIGRLAADIAHEINNPLGYVWSEFRTLRSMIGKYPKGADESATLSEMIGAMEDGLSRIEKVVGSLLEYSRRGGRQQDIKSAYDLVKGINTALDLSHSDYERVAVIELDLQPLPELKVYGNEIDQVLINIIRNAVDAIKARQQDCQKAGNGLGPDPSLSGFHWHSGKPGQIRISCRVENDLVVCEIGNNGNPLEAGQSESIFNAFYTTKPDNQGTGLGLSISKEIIEKHHGGRLTLASHDPVVFRIELPAT